jgi:hypothetical protein
MRRLSFLAIPVAVLLLTGCEAIPVSQHPLSDETNSEVDPALIGLWDMIDESQEEAAKEESAPSTDKPATKEEDESPEADAERPPRFAIGRLAGKERSMEMVSLERPPRFAIGRLAGKERSMEMVSLHLTDDHIEVKRFPLHATKVGKLRMLSVRANPEEMESDFILLRYEVVNENRIMVYFLNRDAIVKSIQRGELKGVVRKAPPKDPNDPNAEERKEQIRITAAPQELRDYLTKNERAAFEPKAIWRMQRAAGN